MSWVDTIRERVEKRIVICKDCPFFKPATKQCAKCGCFLPAKTALPNSKCPINKW